MPTPNDTPRDQGHRSSESGQALVMFAIFFTVFLGMVALVLDQGMLRKTNMDLYNSLDSGALAGVQALPDDPALAEQLARDYIQMNQPGGLPSGDIDVTFRCLIGVEAGLPRLTDVPAVCDPGANADWVVDGDRAFSTCIPSEGDTCNVIATEAPATADFVFGPVVGVTQGSTGDRLAAACKGLCGEPPEVPVDLVMILDRTGSMTGVDTDNARAAADSVRTLYDPRVQWIGLGLLHRSQTVSGCRVTADNSNPWTAVAPGDLRDWVPVGLTGQGASFGSDYSAAGSLMASSIGCFNNSGGQGTDLADPVRMATYELTNSARADSIKAILLLSDGKPNNSFNPAVTATNNYCEDAYNAATTAKAAGIEVFTVGFGLDVEQDHICQDTSGAWVGKSAPALLAAMATSSADNGCPGTENDDEDHYFCVPKSAGASTDLSDIFTRAVTSLTSHSRLINIPA